MTEFEQRHWSPSCERPDNLVAPRPVDPSGVNGPTKRQAAGRHFRQTSTGLYVPSEVDETIVEQRIFEQGHRIRRYGAVTGWAALRWRGAAYFDGTSASGDRLPVPLVVANQPLQADPRIAIDRSQLAQTERVMSGGIWLTTVQRALFDVMRHGLSLREAVVAMDMLAAARLISVALMSLYVAHRKAWTGVPLVRQALALASNCSRSPQETRMRLVWILNAGFPAPLCNVPIFTRAGELLGVPDLFDPVAGVAGEYDGVDHKDRERHRADVAREDLMRRHGIEYFTVVGGDLNDRGLVAARMTSTRARALFAPPESRAWTLTAPPWWRPREEELDLHLTRTGEAPYLFRT